MFFMPWPWGLRMFVCGFWGFVLFWFAWPSLLWGLGWAWSGFLDCCTDYWVLAGCLFVVGWGLVLLVLFGEFDPGSGRTLAACLTHASRTVKGPVFAGSG